MNNRNDLSERLLKFAVDVILYLRTVKNTIETMDMKKVPSLKSQGKKIPDEGLGIWNLRLLTWNF